MSKEEANTVLRQKVLVLYLASSTLDSPVIGWSQFDGTGQVNHMAGDEELPPYKSGTDALQAGWRLIQASPLITHNSGDEFVTSYLKYEFFFEKIVSIDIANNKLKID